MSLWLECFHNNLTYSEEMSWMLNSEFENCLNNRSFIWKCNWTKTSPYNKVKKLEFHGIVHVGRQLKRSSSPSTSSEKGLNSILDSGHYLNKLGIFPIMEAAKPLWIIGWIVLLNYKYCYITCQGASYQDFKLPLNLLCPLKFCTQYLKQYCLDAWKKIVRKVKRLLKEGRSSLKICLISNSSSC